MDLLYKKKESILKKKDRVLTNGGFEKKNKKKTFSGLSESLTRFTINLLALPRDHNGAPSNSHSPHRERLSSMSKDCPKEAHKYTNACKPRRT